MRCLFICLVTLYPFIGYAGNYCDNNNCCDCAAIGVEYLFLKASIYDPYFVLPENTDGDPDGTRFGNLWPYHSGVRAKVFYNLPCTQVDLYGEGLYFSDRETRNLAFAGQGIATKGHAGSEELDDLITASSMLLYRLWSLKGGLRYCFDMCCPLLASARFAIQYANLSLREKLQYFDIDDDINPVDHNTHSWGIGPEVGFDVGYQVLSCLTLVSRGSYALLAGRISAATSSIEILDDTPGEIYFADNNKLSIVMPACELKLGLNYALPFNCFCVNVEIGYDFIRYDDAFNFIRWVGQEDQAEGLSFDHFTPFMVHGLYISFNTGF